MTPGQFDKVVLQDLAKKLAGFPKLDLYHAYDDVFLLCDEIAVLEQKRPDNTIFSETATDAQKHDAIRTSRLISVLLKALYMVADVFLCRFLGALHGNESMSMNAFITAGGAHFTALQEAELKPAYCVAIYRNKLVAHYDHRRLGAYATSAVGVRTLTPLPAGFNIDPADLATITALRGKYQAHYGALAGIENHFKLLTALFYLIPVGAVRALNPDRTTINAIAEKGGTDSQSANEILAALDSFCMGALRCA